MSLDRFPFIWLVDFEFSAPDGERPTPLCLVAREYRTGRTVRRWLTEDPGGPIGCGPDDLFVAYYASAELGCHLALNWPMPTNVVDLYVEFRNLTNGLPTICGSGLIGALTHFGLPAIESTDKEAMRQLAMRGGEYSEQERADLLDYCETDVVALADLLPKMAPTIDVDRALLRGRYMAAAARMEWAGTPIDVDLLDDLRANWDKIKSHLIAAVDADYGVYVPTGRRTVNPDSKLGQAILATAANHECDPFDLADAVDHVWRMERESSEDFYAAKREARAITGLTPTRIERWENGVGRDHTTWPGLDLTARDLAGRFPELGIGAGFTDESATYEDDHAARLWELLSDDRDRPLPKTDGAILRRAAELVGTEPPATYRKLSFSESAFAGWLVSNGIPWPRLETGRLSLDDETFRQMVRRFPSVGALRDLRHSLGQLRLSDLAVGADGRNRCLLSAFRARTGRNQPSNSKFIFGPSAWLRSLIKPEADMAVAYCDWSQQEFGIGAALSGDEAMIAAYQAADPYLEFAKQAGAVPSDATKATHPHERAIFKQTILAVQYGMGPESLAASINQTPAHARELLHLHRETYRTFWAWSDAAVNIALTRGTLRTVFGWTLHVGPDANPRSLANFPCQANGAEMLRLACILATERGITVCAPIHDALLVEGPADGIEATVAATQQAMSDASAVVLAGFRLRTDAEIVAYPDRFSDPRGRQMFGKVTEIMAGLRVEVVPF